MPPVPDRSRKPVNPGPPPGQPAQARSVPTPRQAKKPTPQPLPLPLPPSSPPKRRPTAPNAVKATKATKATAPVAEAPEEVWELRIPQALWWGGVLAAGVLLIVCFEFGITVGERRAARARNEAQAQVAAAPRSTPIPAPAIHTRPVTTPAETSITHPKEPTREAPLKRPSDKSDPLPLITKEPPKEKPKEKPKIVEIPPPVEPAVDVRFDRDILPVFQAKCNSCHGTLSKKGGLDLRTLATTMKGGNSGPGVKPGHAEDSPVWNTIRQGDMPPRNKPQLTAEEKKLILAWVAGMAK